MMEVLIEHIVVEQGLARTKNRRVKVKMIAQKHLEGGMSAAEIGEHYGITLADVHAALAYYYDHQVAFEAEEQHNLELLEKYGIRADEHLAKLRAVEEGIISLPLCGFPPSR